ncbi:hypothetical protein KBB96_02805 [Luteolibacter ambystomatis]|uniref:Uncharacterized protein n=1 Tax=Luteolibacter ambystomatis TaxID=2824561 RepID=A0A975J0M2_9BACT|nr:hypothetical protein [Luteolibacter ambystomatis]QUE51827.1 hypothetical protein KBB96_02805 [Luteolibacter ambystomatis]
MKPLPAEGSLVDRRPSGPSALPTALPQTGGPRSSSNRRNTASPGRGAYPWLLLASTVVSGVFCYLYITKPVILPAPAGPAAAAPAITPAVVRNSPLSTANPTDPTLAAIGPASDRLPGDPAVGPTRAPLKSAPTTGLYEESNFSVQHVVTAEAPNGVVKRLDFKVPVLYRSRNLLWTKREVATARELLGRLADYQEKTRALRAEGVALEDAWNQLMERSMPVVGLQADSPSLLGNQERPGTTSATPPAGAGESINIQPNRK